MYSTADHVELPPFAPSSDDASVLHVQIERWIAGLILDGALPVGSRLPTERDLAAQLGVSRMTLRQSLASLEARQLIRRVAGRNGGSFIHDSGVLVDFTSLPGLAAQIPDSRKRPTSTVRVAKTRPASDAVAARLGIRPTDHVHYVERVRWADDQPVALERSSFPAVLLPDLLSHDLRGSLYELLGTLGHGPVEATERIDPVIDASAAEALGTPKSRPLLRIRRTAVDAAGRSVEYSDDCFRSDKARFVVTSRVADRAAPR